MTGLYELCDRYSNAAFVIVYERSAVCKQEQRNGSTQQQQQQY